QIGDTGLYFQPPVNGDYKIYDAETQRHVPDVLLRSERNKRGEITGNTGRDYLNNVVQALDATASTGNFQIAGQPELIKSILKDLKQTTYRDLGRWANVEQTVGVQLPNVCRGTTRPWSTTG